MPGTIDREMPLLGDGNLHWVTGRRDASEEPRPPIARLMMLAHPERRGGPGEDKKTRKKWFGRPAGPPSTESGSAGEAPVDGALQVVRGTRTTEWDSCCAEDGEFRRPETKMGRMPSLLSRVIDFVQRRCGAKGKGPRSSRTPTPCPLSGGELATTDWQLRQARATTIGLPTPSRSEETLVDDTVTVYLV